MTIEESIGHTPLVELKRINPHRKVRILAKLEGNNPGGSIKDRPALFMIRQAEEAGLLTPEKTILEPTSGNTGIALAMIGAARGYKVKLTLPRLRQHRTPACTGGLWGRGRGHLCQTGHGWGHSRGPSDPGRRPGSLFHAQPVCQHRQLAGPLRDHRPGDLATDRGGAWMPLWPVWARPVP